jgi:hypothetical protein
MVFQKVKKIIARTIGISSSVPKSTRGKIEKNMDTKITSLSVVRSPVQSFIHKFLNVITLGDWNKKLKELGYDKLFHVKLIINGEYALEKRPSVYFGSVRHEKDEEQLNIPVKKDITIGQLIQTAQSKMGNKFTDYDAFDNNCQAFIKGILSTNGLYNSSINSFLFQDLKKLISGLPGYTDKIAKAVTDVAGGVNEALSETTGQELRLGGII